AVVPPAVARSAPTTIAPAATAPTTTATLGRSRIGGPQEGCHRDGRHSDHRPFALNHKSCLRRSRPFPPRQRPPSLGRELIYRLFRKRSAERNSFNGPGRLPLASAAAPG